jgi:hypothetical protein
MWPIALVCGAICGLGAFLVAREFIPGRPGLQGALDRLGGVDRPPAPIEMPDGAAVGMLHRAGGLAQRYLPLAVLRQLGPSDADLDLIGKSPTTHFGEKTLSALVVLVAVPTLTMGAAVAGIGLPFAVSVGGSLLLAAAAWFAPDLSARSAAKQARQMFARAVATYLELLAIERISGAGATQATFAAATVGDSWPFLRISEALERGRWDGKAPWVALRALGTDVAIPELHDVADIMELAGKEGSAVHDQLQSRAAALRDAQLDVEQQIAHDATVRMTIPGTMTVLVYFVMLIFPMGIQMFSQQ